MPIITVGGPSLSLDKRRRLVRGLTAAAVAVYEGFGADSIIVLFRDLRAEDVAKGGELLSDQHDEGAAQKSGQKGGQSAA